MFAWSSVIKNTVSDHISISYDIMFFDSQLTVTFSAKALEIYKELEENEEDRLNEVISCIIIVIYYYSNYLYIENLEHIISQKSHSTLYGYT